LNRPHMITHAIASADGRVTMAPDVLLLYGDDRWAAIDRSTAVRDRLMLMHAPGATLEGSGSFVPDGGEIEPLPPFTGDPAPLYADYLPQAVLDRPNHVAWFVVVDGRGRVRLQYIKGEETPWPGLEGWHALFFVHHQTPPEYLAYLRSRQIPYLVAGDGAVDLAGAMGKLSGKLGVKSVLATGAGRLGGALLRAGLVDEVNIELCPALIGGRGTPGLFDAPPPEADQWPLGLGLLDMCMMEGGRVWLRYEVSGPLQALSAAEPSDGKPA
jgi:2,5-diamino-6-(ribosylamino)-4(3H)-pyrimidinone 5'-phosphate reductase